MYVHEQLTMNAFQLLNKTMFTFSGRIVSCDEQPRKLIYMKTTKNVMGINVV